MQLHLLMHGIDAASNVGIRRHRGTTVARRRGRRRLVLSDYLA
jgi:hypothetical protein